MEESRPTTMKEKGAAMRLRLFSRWQGFREKMRHKRRIVVLDTETFKEHFSLELSASNVFVAVGASVILLIAVTTLLIIFTPLREMVPGYVNSDMVEQTYRNAQAIDSLERLVDAQERMISNIQDVIDGKDLSAFDLQEEDSVANDDITYTHSSADGELRHEIEQQRSRHSRL